VSGIGGASHGEKQDIFASGLLEGQSDRNAISG
jgi:hypothetical protein